jgi:CheY-like chemotaxis protein
VPVVRASSVAEDRWEFHLIAREGASDLPPRPRLAEAVRRNAPSRGKEVKTALIVEDDPCLLDLVARAVVARGFRVLRSSDGQRGLDLVTRHHPDLIILDLMVPDFDGIQIVERVRANPRTNRIPILIHTGAVLTGNEHQRLASQVQAITSKTEPHRLLAHVEQFDSCGEPAPMERGI